MDGFYTLKGSMEKWIENGSDYEIHPLRFNFVDRFVSSWLDKIVGERRAVYNRRAKMMNDRACRSCVSSILRERTEAGRDDGSSQIGRN